MLDSNETPNNDTNGFSLGAILVFTLFVAIVCAGWAMFRYRGLGPACMIVACTWFGLSRSTSRSLTPINNQRMTISELLTVLCACALLHSFSIPAVQSAPQPHRIPTPPAKTNTAQANNAPAAPEAKGAIREQK